MTSFSFVAFPKSKLPSQQLLPTIPVGRNLNVGQYKQQGSYALHRISDCIVHRGPALAEAISTEQPATQSDANRITATVALITPQDVK